MYCIKLALILLLSICIFYYCFILGNVNHVVYILEYLFIYCEFDLNVLEGVAHFKKKKKTNIC